MNSILSSSEGLRILCRAHRTPAPKSLLQLKTESTGVPSKSSYKSRSKHKLTKDPNLVLKEEEDVPLSQRRAFDKVTFVGHGLQTLQV
jgi:hypothetical protein